ncbi:MAG: ferredoxin [Micromonosporaceae bacterium]
MTRPAHRIRVNPIACDAHGVCAGLLPELIRLDPWGYPLIADRPVPAGLLKLARKAAASCPTLALLVEHTDDAARR